LTLVVVWPEPQRDLIRCVADSRVVGQGGASLTDSAPKILPIDVACARADGPPSQPVYRMQLGFAYAGSSLPAPSTHGFVSACLLNLLWSGPAPKPPDLQSIHEWITRVAVSYIRDIGAPFEFLLFGFCPIAARFRVFYFSARPDSDSLNVETSEKQLVDAPETIAIDSGAAAFKRRFDEWVRTGHYTGALRLPSAVIAQLIRERSNLDIGGDVQIAYADKAGLKRLQHVEPISLTSPFLRMTFLSQDVQSFGNIASFFVGMPGLA
jgi:hypothetical protein